MGNWFRKKPQTQRPAPRQRPAPQEAEEALDPLHPNFGVDVDEKSFDQLGDTTGSKQLKQIIRAMAAMKEQGDD